MKPAAYGSYAVFQWAQPLAASACPVPPWKPIVRNDLVFAGMPGLPVILAGQLEGGLGRLGAAREELHRGVLGRQQGAHPLDQLECPGCGRGSGCAEGQAAQLGGNSIDDVAVGVSQVAGQDPGRPIDVDTAPVVGEADPL